ncbi:MAG: cytochrome b [Alphaproteobacteria bacterium]|nr:cytochrome b [Alphaproteobacteria bacterium]MBL6936775.1 cytochrome b [Alphaproteobacteria bacterium]MBL7097544.1 cytochrome b [Alphaproteobacteria bacterium]
MQPISTTAASYDSRTIWFHWLTAVLVVAQWIGAKTIDMWPRGPLRVDAQSLHVTAGIAIGILVLARIVWRVSGGRQLPAADFAALHILAKAVQWGLYLLVLGTVGLGLAMVSLRSMSFFNLFMLPTLADGSRATSGAIHGLHELAGTTILIVAGLHATAALVHRYLLHDGVLARMIPRLASSGP